MPTGDDAGAASDTGPAEMEERFPGLRCLE